AQDIVELQLGLNGHIDALNRGEIERCADSRAFGTRAIVPTNIDDQRVIEFAQVFNGLDHPANLMIRVGGVGTEYFRLVGVHLLLSRIERVPLRQEIRPGSELGIRRNNTELLLVSKNLIAHCVPAHVEFAFHLRDPFRSWMMRRMRTTWHIVEEKRLLW